MLLKHRSYVYCGKVSWLTFLSTTGHLELLGHCTGANSHSFSCSLKRQQEETWVRTSEHTPVEQSEWGGYHAHTYSLVAILMIIWQPVRGRRQSNTPEENLLNSTIWYPTTQNTVWFEQCVSYPRSWAFPTSITWSLSVFKNVLYLWSKTWGREGLGTRLVVSARERG